MFTHTELQKCCLHNTKTCHLPFPSSLLLEGYYYSGGSSPGPLEEAFLQQNHRFVTDSVTKDVLNEPSTRAALSSELGYALGYSVDGATPTDEPGTKAKCYYYSYDMLCVQTEYSEACISCHRTLQLSEKDDKRQKKPTFSFFLSCDILQQLLQVWPTQKHVLS